MKKSIERVELTYLYTAVGELSNFVSNERRRRRIKEEINPRNVIIATFSLLLL